MIEKVEIQIQLGEDADNITMQVSLRGVTKSVRLAKVGEELTAYIAKFNPSRTDGQAMRRVVDSTSDRRN